MNDCASIELLHIQLELENARAQHMRHFIDQYYCYKNNYVTRSGRAKWERIVWGEDETISTDASLISDRKLVVKEHVIPLKRIILELEKLPNNTIEEIRACLDDLLIFATITKSEDKRLRDLKLTSSMPREYDKKEHEWFKNPFARYLKAGFKIAQFSKTHNKFKNEYASKLARTPQTTRRPF